VPEGNDLARLAKNLPSGLPVVIIRLNRVRHVHAEVAELQPEGLSGNPEQPGCLVLAAAGVAENAGQQQPIHVRVRLGIKVVHVRRQTLADESL
jgi:hypothetical protein